MSGSLITEAIRYNWSHLKSFDRARERERERERGRDREELEYLWPSGKNYEYLCVARSSLLLTDCLFVCLQGSTQTGSQLHRYRQRRMSKFVNCYLGKERKIKYFCIMLVFEEGPMASQLSPVH